MGILSRISKVLESNLNALVERAEDPAKLLDQAIEDMKKGRDEAREAIIEARTAKRLAEKRRDKTKAEAAAAEQKAMKALEMGDEDLARRLVELKLTAEERASVDESQVAEADAQIGQLEIAQKELERRLQEMPGKRAVLLARKAAAEAKGGRVGAASKAKDTVSGALEAFDRMEERVIRAEVEAEVKGELGPGVIDTRALDDFKAGEALLALKARMKAQLPATASSTSGARARSEPTEATEPDPVADSLAALKAKLAKEGGTR